MVNPLGPIDSILWKFQNMLQQQKAPKYKRKKKNSPLNKLDSLILLKIKKIEVLQNINHSDFTKLLHFTSQIFVARITAFIEPAIHRLSSFLLPAFPSSSLSSEMIRNASSYPAKFAQFYFSSPSDFSCL